MDFRKIHDSNVNATVLCQFDWYVIECIVIVSMNNSLGGQLCTDKVNITIAKMDTDEVKKDRLVIVPRLNFTCNGRITGIMARVKELGNGNDDNPILQVWRQATDDTKIYNKISEATLIFKSSNLISEDGNDDGNDRIVNFTFGDNKTIDVQLGDVVGYYHPQKSHYQIKHKETVGYQLYEFKNKLNSASLENQHFEIHDDRQPLIQFSMSKYVFLL